MKVYNMGKTQELTAYDLEKGYLKDDKLFIRTEPAMLEILEQSHEEIVAEYPNGGKDIKVVIDTPYQPTREAKDIYEDIQVYIPYTDSELKMRVAQAEIERCLKWFTWYDNQVSQAQRSQRTGTEWYANDGIKSYGTLVELDAEANDKQERIRVLKAQMQGG